jgi:hypothetical protein
MIGRLIAWIFRLVGFSMLVRDVLVWDRHGTQQCDSWTTSKPHFSSLLASRVPGSQSWRLILFAGA